MEFRHVLKCLAEWWDSSNASLNHSKSLTEYLPTWNMMIHFPTNIQQICNTGLLVEGEKKALITNAKHRCVIDIIV